MIDKSLTESEGRPLQPSATSEWFSICSAHNKHLDTCHNCNVGHWVDQADPYVQIRHWLWRKSPDLWREWANRPSSNDGEHLERIFPNLKPLNPDRAKLIRLTTLLKDLGALAKVLEQAHLHWSLKMTDSEKLLYVNSYDFGAERIRAYLKEQE